MPLPCVLRHAVLLPLTVLGCLTFSGRAQLIPSPPDSPAIAASCHNFLSNRGLIEAGTIPAATATALTRNLPAGGLERVARERSTSKQHYASCAAYAIAAIAAQASATPSKQQVLEDMILASAESKLASGQELTAVELAEEKMAQVKSLSDPRIKDTGPPPPP